MRILFLQNGEHDGPGIFARTMHDCGVELRIVHAWRNDPLPAIDGFGAVAIGGGEMSAYETAKYPFLDEEMALIRRARAAQKPALGMCLGAQLMAAALGGTVFPNRAKEIGFHEVRFTEAAQDDPVWHECAQPFQPVHWHGDTFTLPAGATLLAGSDLTENQLFRMENGLYGIQFHLEFDLPVLTGMINDERGFLQAHDIDPEILLRTAAKALPEVEPIAHTVFTRWLSLFFPESPCAKSHGP